MHNIITTENILLIGALLLFVAVMAGKAAYRFGAPALLFFLGVGMLFGINFISFHSVEATQFVGMIALCIILFTGGMDTKFSEIRPVIGPGIVLATAGVVMTAVIVAGFVTLIAPWVGLAVSFPAALLLAATMSSTDSASVFSILRSKKQGLNENLRPLLELESGSNDPMAYVLTIVLIGVLSGGAEAVSVPMSIVKFVIQMLLGGLMGYAIGRIGVWTINRINLSNYSLYPVLLLAFVFFTFSFTDLIGGNGYLAVYLAGLVLGNNQLTQKRSLTIFFDGFTWLVQIVMFLTLGLLVNLDELLQPDVLMTGMPGRGFYDVHCASYHGVRLYDAFPQVYDQSPSLCFLGRSARCRADYFCDLSFAGRYGGGTAAVQRGFSGDDSLAAGTGYDRELDGESARTRVCRKESCLRGRCPRRYSVDIYRGPCQ